jgi:predicted RNA binding protein YcfA (HicA-like mRNA interferase family)
MTQWPAAKARRVLAALLRIGWEIKRESGSHRTLARSGWPDIVFAFHDAKRSGPACRPGSPSTPVSRPRMPERGDSIPVY